MDAERVNYYEACDRAIKAMNRELVEEFGKLKGVDWDKVNVIRTVFAVYEAIIRMARKKYYGIGFEAYVLAMLIFGEDARKAHSMAERAITARWVDAKLNETDFVTLYRFNSETERKAYKLAETLEVSPNRSREIDKAMKYLSQQLAQYAINFTDYAVLKAYEDAGVEFVEWVSEKDERVCTECKAFDGMVYPIREVPTKPHYGCRCKFKPAVREVLDGNAV